MPKHLTNRGVTVEYHPIVIRFTTDQFEALKILSSRANKNISEMVRIIVSKEIDFDKVSHNSN